MANSVSRPTADEIADMADSGHDISRFFTNKGTMKPPFKRVIVDIEPDKLHELDQLATDLNSELNEGYASGQSRTLQYSAKFAHFTGITPEFGAFRTRPALHIASVRPVVAANPLLSRSSR